MQQTGRKVAVSQWVTPQKLSSNQYLLHCASSSGESVDLSEQCDFSVHTHLLYLSVYICCSTVLVCVYTQCTGACSVHIMSFSALCMTLCGLWISMGILYA